MGGLLLMLYKHAQSIVNDQYAQLLNLLYIWKGDQIMECKFSSILNLECFHCNHGDDNIIPILIKLLWAGEAELYVRCTGLNVERTSNHLCNEFVYFAWFQRFTVFIHHSLGDKFSWRLYDCMNYLKK